MGSVHKVPSHVTWKINFYWRRYQIQETLYTGQWHLSPLQSRHLGTSHTSLNLHQLSCCIFLNLNDSMKSLPFQRWFYFGEKPEVAGRELWAAGGLSHLGDLMFCTKTAWDVMHEWAHGHDEAANHQLPIAAAFWIIWIVSMERCSSLTQNVLQIHCSIQSVILNATATQYTWSVNSVYRPTD